jgi:hypothetical protein
MNRSTRILGLLMLTLATTLVAQMASADGNKVDVCHFPPGNMDGFHTISVGEEAAKAHVGNHPFDFVGGCCEGFDDCDDGDPCTADACHGFCTNEPADCSDGNPCTVDSCDSSTGCVNAPIICPDDGDACTTDACDPATGQCTSEVRPCTSDTDCEDGNLCTINQCGDLIGLCGEPGSRLCITGPQFCPNQLCFIRSCDPQQGCVYEPECVDGDPCTVDECDVLGCSFDPLCEDFDSCTNDVCVVSGENAVCENPPIPQCVPHCPCWTAADIANTFDSTSICSDVGKAVQIANAGGTTVFSVILLGVLIGDSNHVTRIENNTTVCDIELPTQANANRLEALLCADSLRASSVCSP